MEENSVSRTTLKLMRGKFDRDWRTHSSKPITFLLTSRTSTMTVGRCCGFDPRPSPSGRGCVGMFLAGRADGIFERILHRSENFCHFGIVAGIGFRE